MRIIQLLTLFAISTASLVTTAKVSPMHIHGNSHLMIKVDKKSFEIKFLAPGTTIVGFEHKPKLKIQKQIIQDVKHVWIKEWHKLFRIKPNLMCKNVESSFKILSSDKEHTDHIIKLKISCLKEIKGQQLQLNILPFYSKISSILLKVSRKSGSETQALIKSKNFKFIL